MRKVLIFLFPLFLFSSILCAAEDEVSIAKAQLNRAIILIDEILPSTEHLESARLNFIKRNFLVVKNSLQQNGLAHAATMRSYQQLIVAFRYSSSFLKQLESEFNTLAIKELFDINELIVKARGFDDTPYTQITANVFSEMHQLFLQLQTLASLPADLKNQINALIPKIGNVIAIAKQGDRPKTFAAAVPLSKEITALYVTFGRVQHANPAFDVILDIQGLNEFYAEFAQIEGGANP